jgi:hypothetical protein
MAALVVLATTYALVKFLWKQPLQNGTGFFLGVEVPAGFYEGPGRVWLRGYRAMLVLLHLVLIGSIGGCFALGRSDLIPWCGFWAPLCVASMLAFQAWTRRKLGANPPVLPVALSLETRRLSDYISWPREALMSAVIAASWWLLLTRGGSHVDWIQPLLVTWMALGLIPGKILMVRCGFPLPAERAEEHYRYQDAMRRGWIGITTAIVWCFLVVLFGVALGRAWPVVSSHPWFLWAILCAFIAVWGTMMIRSFRCMKVAATVGRELRPAGSFATPTRRASCWMNGPYLLWLAIWFGGILALVLYPLFR